MKPKVSIIIPVYNGSNYLKEAIKSALTQTYKNLEILVINDGSRDNGKTAKIAKSFLPRIRYFEKENGGVASALNFGIKKMKGEYFSWLSHDDVYLPDKIAFQMEFMKNCPRKTVLYSNFELINAKGRHLRMFKFKPPPANFIYYLIDEKFINGCTILVPKKALKIAGLFNENLNNVPDYEMWFRLMNKDYEFRHVPKVLVKSRVHPQQSTTLKKDIQLAEENYLYKWLLKNLPLEKIFDFVDDRTSKYLYLTLKFRENKLFGAANYSRLLGLRFLGWRNLVQNLQLLAETFRKKHR